MTATLYQWTRELNSRQRRVAPAVRVPASPAVVRGQEYGPAWWANPQAGLSLVVQWLDTGRRDAETVIAQPGMQPLDPAALERRFAELDESPRSPERGPVRTLAPAATGRNRAGCRPAAPSGRGKNR